MSKIHPALRSQYPEVESHGEDSKSLPEKERSHPFAQASTSREKYGRRTESSRKNEEDSDLIAAHNGGKRPRENSSTHTPSPNSGTRTQRSRKHLDKKRPLGREATKVGIPASKKVKRSRSIGVNSFASDEPFHHNILAAIQPLMRDPLLLLPGGKMPPIRDLLKPRRVQCSSRVFAKARTGDTESSQQRGHPPKQAGKRPRLSGTSASGKQSKFNVTGLRSKPVPRQEQRGPVESQKREDGECKGRNNESRPRTQVVGSNGQRHGRGNTLGNHIHLTGLRSQLAAGTLVDGKPRQVSFSCGPSKHHSLETQLESRPTNEHGSPCFVAKKAETFREKTEGNLVIDWERERAMLEAIKQENSVPPPQLTGLAHFCKGPIRKHGRPKPDRNKKRLPVSPRRGRLS